jgi:hypothetical protein
MTDRGGIVYGMKLEGVDQRAQVARYCSGLHTAIISEANITSFPGIIDCIREVNPACKIGLEVSSWGGWLNTPEPGAPDYWPMRSEVGRVIQERGWALRRIDDQPVTVGSPPLVLMDLTNPDALNWYIGEVSAFKRLHAPDFLFFDECHASLAFLPRASEIVYHDPNYPWVAATARLLRRTGGGMVNGTILHSDAPGAIRGRYIQNVRTDIPKTIVTAKAAADAGIPIIFEHPVTTPTPYVALEMAGLIATFPNSCGQINIGGRYREPIPDFGKIVRGEPLNVEEGS